MFSYVANKRYEIIKFPEPCPVRQNYVCVTKRLVNSIFVCIDSQCNILTEFILFTCIEKKKIYILSRLNRQKS